MHARTIMAAAAVALVGCTGAIQGDGSPSRPGPGGNPSTGPGSPGNSGSGGPSGNGSGSGGGSGGGSPSAPLPPIGSDPLAPDRSNPACKDITPGPAPIRRLTRAEYDNTIRDLLGEDLGLGKAFPSEELQHSFDNNADLRSVSDVLAENYHTAAKEIGKRVTAKLSTLLPCDAAKDGESACLDRFLDGFGQRVWRRPLDQEEKTDLKAVFAAAKGTSFAEGIDGVVRVMLLSPQFMYRIEQGVDVAGAGYQRLSHWDMASRLSYLLWGTMPDAELFSAAEAGKLGTRAEVAAQAKRMIDDPRANALITNFASQWLQLRELTEAAKDTTLYPAWKDEYLPLFKQETEELISSVWRGDAKVDTLLASTYTYVNGPLATFYGIKGITGDAFQKVTLDATQRAGVLTNAGWLAAKSGPDQSSPILRGAFVREQIFCQPLPQPPITVDANPPELNPKLTTKERFAAHRNDPSCEGCHRLIDPIGFGFENYDATGAYRSMESGKMVDSSGELAATDVDGPFKGAVELSQKLAKSKDVEACVASHWFNFALGREPGDSDACTVQSLGAAFSGSGGDLRQLLLATVQTDAFLFKGGLR